nr:MAG TPA: hypothetical protein [Siphoviridae sp. ctwYi19]
MTLPKVLIIFLYSKSKFLSSVSKNRLGFQKFPPLVSKIIKIWKLI